MTEHDPDPRRERKDSRRNLDLVLTAAHELFAERGAEVTMEEVARRAGVGVATIYRRFASKAELFAVVSAAACRSAAHCLIEAANSEHDPLARLRAIIAIHYRESNGRVALLELHPALHAEDAASCAAPAQAELYSALHSMVAALVAEGQSQGHIRPGDPAILTAICLELLDARTIARLGHATGISVETVADEVARFAIAAIAAETHGTDEGKRR